METHAHTHATENEELRTLRGYPQLLAQLDELDQSIRAVQYPHLGIGDGLLDLAPPLVDQVGWREYQRTMVAFCFQYCGGGDTHCGFAAAHLTVDDGGTFAAIDQQLGDGVDHIGLSGEQLPLQAGEYVLAMTARLAAIDGRIGTIERLKELIAEFGHKVLQADVERG